MFHLHDPLARFLSRRRRRLTAVSRPAEPSPARGRERRRRALTAYGDTTRALYFTAIGDTVNLAAHIKEVAEPGSVLVSQQRAIADFFEAHR